MEFPRLVDMVDVREVSITALTTNQTLQYNQTYILDTTSRLHLTLPDPTAGHIGDTIQVFLPGNTYSCSIINLEDTHRVYIGQIDPIVPVGAFTDTTQLIFMIQQRANASVWVLVNDTVAEQDPISIDSTGATLPWDPVTNALVFAMDDTEGYWYDGSGEYWFKDGYFPILVEHPKIIVEPSNTSSAFNTLNLNYTGTPGADTTVYQTITIIDMNPVGKMNIVPNANLILTVAGVGRVSNIQTVGTVDSGSGPEPIPVVLTFLRNADLVQLISVSNIGGITATPV